MTASDAFPAFVVVDKDGKPFYVDLHLFQAKACAYNMAGIEPSKEPRTIHPVTVLPTAAYEALLAAQPREWSAETIGSAPECDQWWVESNGVWDIRECFAKEGVEYLFEMKTITRAIPIIPPINAR